MGERLSGRRVSGREGEWGRVSGRPQHGRLVLGTNTGCLSDQYTSIIQTQARQPAPNQKEPLPERPIKGHQTPNQSRTGIQSELSSYPSVQSEMGSSPWATGRGSGAALTSPRRKCRRRYHQTMEASGCVCVLHTFEQYLTLKAKKHRNEIDLFHLCLK